MDENLNMDGFLSSFGITPTETGEEDIPETETTEETTTEETMTEETVPAEPAAEQEKTAAEEPDTKPAPANDGEAQKKAAAWAQLRVENKQLNSLVKGVAEVLGIQDTGNNEAVLSSLKNAVVEAQAKKQGIPPETLRRLEQLEAKEKEYSTQQLQQAAYLGFQKVKDTFNLSNEQLASFADDLSASGANPFVEPVDVIAEYKLRNFEKLLADAEQKGIQKEAARSAKAGAHSTQPNNKQGKGETNLDKVSTTKDLEAWFASNTK